MTCVGDLCCLGLVCVLLLVIWCFGGVCFVLVFGCFLVWAVIDCFSKLGCLIASGVVLFGVVVVCLYFVNVWCYFCFMLLRSWL